MKQAYIKRLDALEAQLPSPRAAGQLTIAAIEAMTDEELDARIDEVAGPELGAMLRRLSPAEIDALLVEYEQ